MLKTVFSAWNDPLSTRVLILWTLLLLFLSCHKTSKTKSEISLFLFEGLAHGPHSLSNVSVTVSHSKNAAKIARSAPSPSCQWTRGVCARGLRTLLRRHTRGQVGWTAATVIEGLVKRYSFYLLCFYWYLGYQLFLSSSA